MMNEDKLFKKDEIDRDFEFNEDVAAVFDNMLNRSVPFYDEIIKMIVQIASKFLKNGDTIYDFGSSTGTTLIELSRKLSENRFNFIGIDNSEAMVKRAQKKAKMFSKNELINFVNDDITRVDIDNAGMIIMNYTMQFLRPMIRGDFLKRIFNSLKNNGVLIISEKVISHDPMINRSYIDFYLEYKRAMGYSELEISKKREALENVLIPFSVEENIELLSNAGFNHVEPFFKWFNFCSFIAVKDVEN